MLAHKVGKLCVLCTSTCCVYGLYAVSYVKTVLFVWLLVEDGSYSRSLISIYFYYARAIVAEYSLC